MLGHTKKHSTEEVARKKTETYQEIDTPMPFDEAMNILLAGASQSAVMLRGLRNREGITQAELGKLLDVEQTNISQMERGKRQIGKQIATRLAKVFDTDYRLFL
jgi:DNA-binding XRE family transcriptional regulator